MEGYEATLEEIEQIRDEWSRFRDIYKVLDVEIEVLWVESVEAGAEWAVPV